MRQKMAPEFKCNYNKNQLSGFLKITDTVNLYPQAINRMCRNEN